MCQVPGMGNEKQAAPIVQGLVLCKQEWQTGVEVTVTHHS